MIVRTLHLDGMLALALCCACSSAPQSEAAIDAPATSNSAAAGMDSHSSTEKTASAPAAGGTNPVQTSNRNQAGAGVMAMSTTMGVAGTAATAGRAGGAGAMGMMLSTAAAGTGVMPSAGAVAQMQPAAGSGTLPVPSSLDKAGPFEIIDQPDTGPGKQFRLFAPKARAEDTLKFPVVAWSPGAGAFPDAYLTFLNVLASQGFVTLSYNSTAEGSNLVDAIDWLIAENERADSILFGKLDTQKIAAGGHSAGSLATFEMADDPRLTTTLHMSGGSFNPETAIPKLRKPALMVCGDMGGDGLTNGDLANPMCITDFEKAQVPVFFAVVKGAGHTALNDAAATAGIGTEPDDPKKALFIKATIAWLRWQLADDQSLKKMFVGDDCELCTDPGYAVMQKNLN